MATPIVGMKRISSILSTRPFKCLVRHYHQHNYDVAIVGGGIVGLATAQELINRDPSLKYILLEKEDVIAKHQTGHNSGVMHAGIYYASGSLKAKLCVEGLKLLYDYCDENNIPYKRVGKLIVAVSNEQLAGLQKLFERGKLNNVPGLQLVSGDSIKEIEPYCQGVAAIHSPYTGIVDYTYVSHVYARSFETRGGIIVNGYEVNGFDFCASSANEKDVTYPVVIKGKGQPSISCKYVITCAGLYSDELSKLSGCETEPKIIPFRGDYLVLKPEKCDLVRGNIYPVPDPRFPFLGVHFTPRMDGSVWLGPNAILAFKKEGYKLFDFSLGDSVKALTSRGLQNLLLKNWKFAFNELYEGIFLRKTVEKLQQFIPHIRMEDIQRGPSGVRAQALDMDGNLVDDFVFDFGTGELGKRCLHVRNAPSPAATSSLAIAKMVADKFLTVCQKKS